MSRNSDHFLIGPSQPGRNQQVLQSLTLESSQIERIEPPSASLLDRYEQNPLVKFSRESAKKLAISTSDSSVQEQAQFGVRRSESLLSVNRIEEGEDVELAPPTGQRPPGIYLDEDE